MIKLRRAAAGGAVSALTLTVMALPSSSAWAAAPTSVPVIVAGRTGQSAAVTADVARVGGRVRQALAVVNGVTATVPAGRLAELRRLPGVRSVTPDQRGHLMGIDPTLGYDVAGDDGSLYDAAQVTHAKDAWAHGYTGKGVDVALIDSGVAPVQGLTSGNLVNGPDLSFESQDPDLAHKDTFGHGTHMASIIAGRDATSTGTQYAKPDSHQFTGIAPDARLISVKVAASDGGSDVSQVIAGIDWVTQHAHAPGYNIRVLNLSYGTDSVQDPSVDPLSFAVENAWRAGITVVVSSGNDGTNRSVLADPASDPLVLAVGADDPNGTDSVGDDQVPAFAQRGTATRYVDLIAPAVHVLGLRSPNSRVDQANPSARVGSRFFRGSGTSQAAAVVSGLTALYLSAHPEATPDQVKHTLMLASTAPSYVKRLYAGLGVPDVNKAIGAKLAPWVQPATNARGTGTLEGSRGTVHAYNGVSTLTGEQDIFGQPWDPATWPTRSAARTAWSGGVWNGNDWTGAGLTDTAWAAAGWASHAWSGNEWDSHAWSDSGWDSHAWSDSGWDSHAWSDVSWDSHAWSDVSWDSHAWSNSSWS
jgi:serine protease AprX